MTIGAVANRKDHTSSEGPQIDAREGRRTLAVFAAFALFAAPNHQLVNGHGRYLSFLSNSV